MKSKTKILVLKLKELILAGFLIGLAICLIALLVLLLKPQNDKPSEQSKALYHPGKYTTSLQLGGNTLDVEVTVSDDTITSIELKNISEIISVMYPLMEPSIHELADQIIETQSLDNITYSDDNQYTSMVLLNAIAKALNEASTDSTQ